MRDRSPQLGGLADVLEELLDLIAGQQLLPQSADHLAVQSFAQGPLDVGARERSRDGLLDQRTGENTVQRPLDRFALDGAHNRLLGNHLECSIDLRCTSKPLRGSRA